MPRPPAIWLRFAKIHNSAATAIGSCATSGSPSIFANSSSPTVVRPLRTDEFGAREALVKGEGRSPRPVLDYLVSRERFSPEKACRDVPILAQRHMNDRPHEKIARAVLCERGRAQAGARMGSPIVGSRPSEADRHSVGKDIQKVEFGWPLGRPHCASLGSGLWEVRSTLDGNRIARVIFCMGDGHMILLHGFIKKTQKTPLADIALALKRQREVT
jgi:phage-related protein